MAVAVFPEKITVAACALEAPNSSKIQTSAIVSLVEFCIVIGVSSYFVVYSQYKHVIFVESPWEPEPQQFNRKLLDKLF